MLTGELEDFTGSITCLVFYNESFDQLCKTFCDDHIVSITGRARFNNDEFTLIVQDVSILERAGMDKIYYIDIENLEIDELEKIKFVCSQFRGSFPVHLKHGEQTIVVHQKYWINDDVLCRSQLENCVGNGRVWAV